jgi:hypothetical protein
VGSLPFAFSGALACGSGFAMLNGFPAEER